MRYIKQFSSCLAAITIMLSMTGCGVVIEKTEPTAKTTEETTKLAKEVELTPQDDYYGYINNETIEGYDLKYSDVAVGAGSEIMESVDQEIFMMIEDIVNSKEDYAPGSNRQLLRDGYNQYLAYVKDRNSSAKEQFEVVAKDIKSSKTTEDIAQDISMLIGEGVLPIFMVDVSADIMTGDTNALYLFQKDDFFGFTLEDIYKEDGSRQLLHSYATNVLVATGEEPKTASKKADDLVYRIIDIACGTDYEIMKTANVFKTLKYKDNKEVDKLMTAITIGDIEKMCDLDNPKHVWIIQDEEQLTAISELFKEENIEALKTLLLCEYVYKYKDFLQEDYSFLGQFGLTYNLPDEQMAALAVRNLFPYQISELYAEYYYTEEMDEQLNSMYSDIKGSYRKLINDADWLTQDTRNRLIDKLENMPLVAGGGTPHRVVSTDEKLIGRDAFETYRNAKKKLLEDNKKLVGKKIDKTTTDMCTYEVNAQYNIENKFTITVAIMHAPYFDLNADYATNLGGLGMVMGHEIGHAFDSMGIDFDENGRYSPDGICEEDRQILDERLKAMEEYYSSFTVMDIYHVDGEKTSGENYADKSAMECVIRLVKTDKEREKLFENYAKIWAQITEDNEAIDSLEIDEHSPTNIRVNAILSSTKEFYDLYDVKPGDGMYIEPEKRVSRW